MSQGSAVSRAYCRPSGPRAVAREAFQSERGTGGRAGGEPAHRHVELDDGVAPGPARDRPGRALEVLRPHAGEHPDPGPDPALRGGAGSPRAVEDVDAPADRGPEDSA